MDELRGRFRRLDRVSAPDLWHEAVERAAQVEVAPRPTFNPGLALIAIALLLAALAGAIVVGGWLNRQLPAPKVVTYDNGMIVAYAGCGRLVTLDPISLEVGDLVAGSPGCTVGETAFRPAWSSDGSRLAYLVPTRRDSSTAPGVTGVWLYDATTGEARQLDECPGDRCEMVDISPDGSLIAYVDAYVDGSGDWPASLVVVGVDSGETHSIHLAAPPGRGGPVFSPDGSQIALPLVGGESGLYLVDVSGVKDGAMGSPTLLHGIVEAADLAWSPDGDWIAYTQTGNLGLERDVWNGKNTDQAVETEGTGIVVVSADGTESRVVATGPNGGNSAFPTWSADSASVAYLAVSVANPPISISNDPPVPSKLTLWTVAIDGDEPTQIYESDCCYSGFAPPAWSPDGEWIALEVEVEDNAAESGVVLVRADGSEVRRMQGIPLEPVWQPIPEH